MTIIVMLDDFGGMLFNRRRQSQDAVLRQRILTQLPQGQKLWMNTYSARQFAKEAQENLVIDDDFLTNAGTDAVCFVENVPTAEYLPKIDRIIAYRWNREYPRDMVFDLELSDWNLESSAEFVGKSHERITEEVYVK